MNIKCEIESYVACAVQIYFNGSILEFLSEYFPILSLFHSGKANNTYLKDCCVR